jgi:transglutaminase-like putative cysteine protease
MDRRRFLTAAVPAAATLGMPLSSRAQSAAPWSNGERWKAYEIVTRVEVQKPEGLAMVWIPLPLAMDTDYFRTLGHSWTGNAEKAGIAREAGYGSSLVYAEWKKLAQAPVIEVTSRFMARDRAVDLSRPGTVPEADKADLALWLKPTEYIPTDGIVRETALKATKGARTSLDKARAVYEWVVDNTFRDAKVRGCGWGDIKTMLETGNMGGKCGDLNALFVGLARSVGVPARDVYGLRVAPSQWGYRSMSASGTVTGAQHCRAEFYLPTHGWVPVDPADVRKVVLEEPPGKLQIGDPKVKLAREKLFGAWEMNWCAYNYAHDVKLPNSQGAAVPYLMYPNAETSSGRKDSLDPANFRYTITAKEIAA